MTVQCIDGGEYGVLPPNASTSGTFSLQSTIARSGTYAYRFNNTSVQTGNVEFQTFAADGTATTMNIPTPDGTIYCNGWFYFVTGPTSGNTRSICGVVRSDGAIHLRIHLTGDGNLAAYNLTGLMATGTTVLQPLTWYLISVHATAGTNKPWELKINGAVEISGTATLYSNPIRGFSINTFYSAATAEAVDFYWDDIIVDDAAYPPDGRVLVSVPNGNGVQNEWTFGTGSSNFAECDEVPPDGGTTSYVQCDTTNADSSERVEFAMQNFDTAGGTGTQINAVQPMISVREVTSVTSANRMRFVVSTAFLTNAFNHTTTFRTIGQCYGLNPNTGLAWTTTTFNAAQLGSTEVNAIAMRMDVAYMQFHYTPPVDTKHWFRLVHN